MKLVENKRSLLDNFTMALLKGRQEAILFTLFFSFLPYFSFLATISVAIVTLRKGVKEGAFISMVVMLPLLSVAAYQGNVFLGIEHGIATLGLGWLLASILRVSCSWAAVLMTTVFLSAVVGLMVNLFYPHHISDSKLVLLKLFDIWQQQGQLKYDIALIKANIDWFASYFLGMQIALVALAVLSNLGFARYMQARIFNPGGFGREFLNLRLSFVNAVIFVITVLGFICEISVVKTFIIVSAFPLIIAGISLMHWRVRRWSSGRLMILLPTYFLLIAFPFSFVVLMLIGFADMWFDFRNFQRHS